MKSGTAERYSGISRLLHWVSAAVILWATISGIYMAACAGPAVKQLISYINVSVTSLLTPLFAARVIYALCSRKPKPLDVSRSEQHAARIGHFLLYTLTSVVLVSGILMMEQDIRIFDWMTVPRPLHDPAMNGVFARTHRASSSLLAIMIAGHVAAVVRHQARGRQVLKRMF